MMSGQFRAGQLVALLVMSGFTAGCGQSTYAERINRTARVLSYHQHLDQNLQPTAWTRGDWGMSMRLPLKFQLKPAPPPPKTNEEGVTEVVEDTRQPGYLGIELPGLVAAWEIPGQALLYLCTNHQRFVDSQANVAAVDPETFFADLEAVLQQGFEVTFDSEPARGPTELHRKYSEKLPPTDEFAPPNTFQAMRIEKPTDTKFSANLWELNSGKIQAALILVYLPASGGSVESATRVALETLRVDPVVPRAAASPGAAGTPAPVARPAF